MNISLEDLDVDVVESTADNDDAFGGRWGWYWHEIHNKPRGPFGDPAAAIFDLAEWVRRRYVDPPPRPVGDAALAQVFLRNAEGFLKAAEQDASSEVALASCCYALELILNGYLLSRGSATNGMPSTSAMTSPRPIGWRRTTAFRTTMRASTTSSAKWRRPLRCMG